MKISILILALTFLTQSPGWAKWEVEIDPLAYLAKGHSFHLRQHWQNGMSLDLGVFGLEVPEFAETNKNYVSRFDGYGFKLSYHGSNPEGWFAGIGGGRSLIKATQKITQESQTLHTTSVGAHLGYRFGKEDFYITPWIGFDWTLNPENLQFQNETYKVAPFSIFPTIHLGYRF